jgi:hypothetical protein
LLFGGGYLTRLLTEPESEKAGSTGLSDQTYAEVLPKDGIAVRATWGDVLPQMVAVGALDPTKFTTALKRPLTDVEQRILTAGADEPIRINAANAHFVLNALWGVGIANRNPILTTTGPMSQMMAPDKRGTLASTGGWTLGEKPGGEYLAQFDLIPLTSEQQAVLEEVATNSYRPCCSNPTAFPDCNHGAAGLAMAESRCRVRGIGDEIFEALRGFNSFWYLSQYVLARYFERRGTSWPKTDAKVVLSADYSSGQGWKSVATKLQQEEPIQGLPGSGGCAA